MTVPLSRLCYVYYIRDKHRSEFSEKPFSHIMLFSLQTLTNVLLAHIIVVRMVSASTLEVRTPVNVIQDTMEMDLPVQVRNIIFIHPLHEKTQLSLENSLYP